MFKTIAVLLAAIGTAFHAQRLPHVTASTTCYAQGGITASGVDAYFGEVAVLPGTLPLGAKIRLDKDAFGRREYTVWDHIGYGSELDIFNPSETACIDYGRQERGYVVLSR